MRDHHSGECLGMGRDAAAVLEAHLGQTGLSK